MPKNAPVVIHKNKHGRAEFFNHSNGDTALRIVFRNGRKANVSEGYKRKAGADNNWVTLISFFEEYLASEK
jgi:hypothetical protein